MRSLCPTGRPPGAEKNVLHGVEILLPATDGCLHKAAVFRNFYHCAKNRALKAFGSTQTNSSNSSAQISRDQHTGAAPAYSFRIELLVGYYGTSFEAHQDAALPKITARFAVVAFLEVWVFNYGILVAPFSDNGHQFAAKFFQSVCSSLGITSVYTGAYHPQSNEQVEGYDRTVTAMLRNNVNEHQDDWEIYSSASSYAYNNQMHKSTKSKPFELVLSRPATDFTLHPDVIDRPAATRETREEFSKRMDITIQRAYGELEAIHERYKRNSKNAYDMLINALAKTITYTSTLLIRPGSC